MSLTRDQKAALQHVYSQIAPDIEPDTDPEEIAELLIDANRLTLFGYPTIDTEMSTMARKDYGETIAMIVRELGL